VAGPLHAITAFESVPERAADALALAERIGRHLSTSEGVVQVQLLQRLHRPDQLEIVSSWESQDAYERAWNGPAVVTARQEMEELLVSPIDDRLHLPLPEAAALHPEDP
jgi:quinol monooxygenase YgiN